MGINNKNVQMSSAFNNWRCRGCAMHTDCNGCAATVSGWDMVNSDTGEYINAAVRVFDASGDAVTMCRGSAWVVAEICSDDDEYHTNYVYVYGDGYADYYTADYARDNFIRCDDCGNWIYPDAARNINGYTYCADCAREHNVIKSYHYHKGEYFPVGCDEHDRYIGLELETDGFGDWEDRNTAAAAIMNNYGDAVVLENDCSLDCGFEIITQPHSVGALDCLDIGGIINTLDEWGACSAPDTAGLHMHFSRTWFGLTDDSRRAALANMARAYVQNWETLVKLSARESYYSIEDYACAPDCAEDATDADALYSINYSRYCAVNNTGSATVEFRLGSGWLDENYIRNWIQLHIDMIDACKRGQTFVVNDDYTITITGAAETAAA